MANTSAKKRPVFALNFKNKELLYRCYMSFIENGGFFIPTKKTLTLGQKVGLKVMLPHEEEIHKVKANVVWVTPDTAHKRWKQGVGVQFTGEIGDKLSHKIEGLLAGALQSKKPTYTL